jgi:hypothetical protein
MPRGSRPRCAGELAALRGIVDSRRPTAKRLAERLFDRRCADGGQRRGFSTWIQYLDSVPGFSTWIQYEIRLTFSPEAIRLKKSEREGGNEMQRQRDTRYNITKIDAGSVVHAKAATNSIPDRKVMFCTGRAVSDWVGTSEKVTCKACIAAGASGGMGPFAGIDKITVIY